MLQPRSTHYSCRKESVYTTDNKGERILPPTYNPSYYAEPMLIAPSNTAQHNTEVTTLPFFTSNNSSRSNSLICNLGFLDFSQAKTQFINFQTLWI
jgi:hypothetical protein